MPTEDAADVLTGVDAIDEQPNAKIEVTINVTAVDEPPVFTAGDESITFAEDGDINPQFWGAMTTPTPRTTRRTTPPPP